MEKGPRREKTTARTTQEPSQGDSALARARRRNALYWKKQWDRVEWVFHDTWQQCTESHLLTVAGSLAYTSILSVIPLVTVCFAFFRAVGGLDTLYSHIEPLVIGALAQGTGQAVMGKIKEFVENIHTGALGASGSAMLIVTSLSLLNSAEKAINHIWHCKTQRSLFNRIMSYWFIISMGPLGMSFAIAASSSDDLQFANVLPSGAVIAILCILAFFAINKWVPNRAVNSLPALWGSLFTTLLIVLAQVGFSQFAAQAVNYNKIYGSLGAIPIFMLWIYLQWIIVLAGTAFSAAIQKRFELS